MRHPAQILFALAFLTAAHAGEPTIVETDTGITVELAGEPADSTVSEAEPEPPPPAPAPVLDPVAVPEGEEETRLESPDGGIVSPEDRAAKREDLRKRREERRSKGRGEVEE